VFEITPKGLNTVTEGEILVVQATNKKPEKTAKTKLKNHVASSVL